MTTDASPDDPERIMGITLEQYAAICAAIAEGDRPCAKVLEQHDLTDAKWATLSLAWMRRIAEDVQLNRDRAQLPLRYADAFGTAQGAHKQVVPMSVEDWARLTVDVMNHGAPGPALIARGLSQADYLRLARHFAKVLSTDSLAARQFETTFAALQPKEADG
jgi:hypothetical protein